MKDSLVDEKERHPQQDQYRCSHPRGQHGSTERCPIVILFYENKENKGEKRCMEARRIFILTQLQAHIDTHSPDTGNRE